jgi:hypothetical protein
MRYKFPFGKLPTRLRSLVRSSVHASGVDETRLTLVETFDRISLTEILQTMPGRDLLAENSIGNYFAIASATNRRRSLSHWFRSRPPMGKTCERDAESAPGRSAGTANGGI